MAHGGEAQLGVGHPLQGDEVRVLDHPLQVLAAAGAGRQRGWVLVGRQGQAVQLAAGAGTEAFQFGQPGFELILGQVGRQQAGQGRVAGEEVHPAAVGNVQIVGVGAFEQGVHGGTPSCRAPRLGSPSISIQ
ncbi:hypothetical protein D9M70_419970 [compost metagenome]